MSRRESFAIGEWYHCYTRGIDKRKTFLSSADYARFLHTLYLSNRETQLRRSDFSARKNDMIFRIPRGKPLVAIAAYCVMPNHFHLLLQEIQEGGITKFMQRVGTGYAMYFNQKYKRSGGLFVKPFRSRRIHDDAYLRKVAQYIHLNPAEIVDHNWKLGKRVNMPEIARKLKRYQYSSLLEYEGDIRPEGQLIDPDSQILISDGMQPLRKSLDEATEYYREIQRDVEPLLTVKAT